MVQKYPKKTVYAATDVLGAQGKTDDDAERVCLSSVLSDQSQLDVVLELCKPDDFASDAHKRVLNAAISLRDRDEPVDVQTVVSYLRETDTLQAVGGVAFLARLIDLVPSVPNVRSYARTVARVAKRRRAGQTLTAAAAQAIAGTEGDDAFFEQTARSLDALLEDGVAEATPELAYSIADRRSAELELQWTGKREIRGLSTGIPALDAICGGLRMAALSIVAAHTGGGKTAFSTQVAAALSGTMFNGEKIGVLIISLEMLKDEIFDRFVCQRARIKDETLQSGEFSADETVRVREAVEWFSNQPISIYDAEATIQTIRSCLRRAQRDMAKINPEVKIRLIIVDYLLLMQKEDADREDIQISMLTRGLKRIAMSEKLHVMALTQFNRDAQEGDGRPALKHLKGSSSVEQDANIVFFIHRPELAIPNKDSEASKRLIDYAEIIVAKNRKGGRGVVKQRFENETTKFYTPEAEDFARWKLGEGFGDDGPRKKWKKRA